MNHLESACKNAPIPEPAQAMHAYLPPLAALSDLTHGGNHFRTRVTGSCARIDNAKFHGNHPAGGRAGH